MFFWDLVRSHGLVCVTCFICYFCGKKGVTFVNVYSHKELQLCQRKFETAISDVRRIFCMTDLQLPDLFEVSYSISHLHVLSGSCSSSC